MFHLEDLGWDFDLNLVVKFISIMSKPSILSSVSTPLKMGMSPTVVN